MIKGYIPSTKKETDDLGWKKPDVVIVTGDAYIDHPYFQTASAGRFLNSKGFRTAMLDMPDISKDEDWKKFGRPALFFLVVSGKEDSMAMNYTAFKKFRSTDPYIPGGQRTHRPDRAVIRYCNKLKEFYKDVPVILAGPEAVCRMTTHYDYWTDKLRKPILFDSKADMVLFGNIEHNLVKICELIKSGQRLSDIRKLNAFIYNAVYFINSGKKDRARFFADPIFEIISKTTEYPLNFFANNFYALSEIFSLAQDAKFLKLLIEKDPEHESTYSQKLPKLPMREKTKINE